MDIYEKDIQKLFNEAGDSLKEYYMLMDWNNKYFYFKHKITRESIKIERA